MRAETDHAAHSPAQHPLRLAVIDTDSGFIQVLGKRLEHTTAKDVAEEFVAGLIKEAGFRRGTAGGLCFSHCC
mgnify:CR=1 FL=1